MRFPISFINQSTIATDDEVYKLMLHLQIQVTRDFSPVWGVDANLSMVWKGQTPSSNAWQLVFLDDADQAGALGYHELTASGLPLGKVFVKTTQAAGLQYSVTASHELLEMLVDPDINLTVFVQSSNTAGRLFAYEVGDAVESDNFGYTIGTQYTTLVSDFVTPAWFEPAGTVLNPRFDFMGHVTSPFQLTTGGYIGIFDVTKGSGWQQLTNGVRSARQRPREDMRMSVVNRRRSLI